MNTEGLAKLYDTLTPRERLPLIIGAAARGDEGERQRLMASAPKMSFQVTDYFGLAEALKEAAEFHLLTLLDLAANYWQWWGLWMAHDLPGRSKASSKPDRRRKKDAEAEGCRLAFLVRYFAYRFTVHMDGWRQFCSEMHIDPEVQLNFMIGWDMITRTEQRARDLAFTPEGAALFLWSETVDPKGEESGDDKLPQVETAAGLAQVWHVFVDERMRWWGSSKD